MLAENCAAADLPVRGIYRRPIAPQVESRW